MPCCLLPSALSVWEPPLAVRWPPRPVISSRYLPKGGLRPLSRVRQPVLQHLVSSRVSRLPEGGINAFSLLLLNKSPACSFAPLLFFFFLFYWLWLAGACLSPSPLPDCVCYWGQGPPLVSPAQYTWFFCHCFLFHLTAAFDYPPNWNFPVVFLEIGGISPSDRRIPFLCQSWTLFLYFSSISTYN